MKALFGLMFAVVVFAVDRTVLHSPFERLQFHEQSMGCNHVRYLHEQSAIGA